MVSQELSRGRSVIAPPDIDVDLAIELERYASVESSAGAHIYRISEERVAKELSAGATAKEILDFFATHSSTPVPQNVDYLINDAERRTNSVRAGSAHSYVIINDVALMARALAVKSAKLQSLASTVAVSDLPFAQLEAALRKKGIHLPQQDVGPAQVSTVNPPVRHHVDSPILMSNKDLMRRIDKIRERPTKAKTTKR